jgi:hypothetical protein
MSAGTNLSTLGFELDSPVRFPSVILMLLRFFALW